MSSSSAPKRRKTSPTTSIPVESTTPTEAPPPKRLQRPSFASPTKASLSRHNPDILRSRQSAIRPEDVEEATASRPTSRDSNASMSVALNAQLERHSEGDGIGSDPPGPGSPDDGQAKRAPQAIIEGEVRLPLRSANSSAARSRLPMRNPRPLLPSGPENDEDILDPFLRRGLRQSPPSGVLPVRVEEEPQLPPTPQHPDPVVSTPPSGIHNTPSKRPRRSKALAQRIERGSSPSKQPKKPLRNQIQKQARPNLMRIARRGSPVTIAPQEALVPSQPQLQTRPEETEAPSEFAPGTHPLRRVRRRDPDAEKKKERDALLEEVLQLEADLALAKKENESVANDLPLISSRSDILSLLERHLVPPDKQPEPDLATQWLEAAMNTANFLPFGGSTSFASLFPRTKLKKEKPIISHHPVMMTAEEELPYLQVFTPLTFTSSIAMVPQESSDELTLQKHSINVKSANPPGLFASRLEMTVNTKTLTITNLAVPRLELTAVEELMPFIENIVRPLTGTEAKGTSSAHAKNITLVTWAMGEWYRVAVRRAKFWSALEKQLLSKEGLVECVTTMRSRNRKRRRRRRDAEDEEEGSQSTNETTDLDDDPVSKAELLPHMGRTSMDLEIPNLADPAEGSKSELRVNWKIEFDWTGEARSKLGVEISVPSKWHSTDDRNSLAGLPKLFDTLLRGGERPSNAVRTVIALLAGDGGS